MPLIAELNDLCPETFYAQKERKRYWLVARLSYMRNVSFKIRLKRGGKRTISSSSYGTFDRGPLRSRWQSRGRPLSTGRLYCRSRRRLRPRRYIRVAVTIFHQIREHSRKREREEEREREKERELPRVEKSRPPCERLNRSSLLPPLLSRWNPACRRGRGKGGPLVTRHSRIPITISRTNRRLGARRRVRFEAMVILMLVGEWASNE